MFSAVKFHEDLSRIGRAVFDQAKLLAMCRVDLYFTKNRSCIGAKFSLEGEETQRRRFRGATTALQWGPNLGSVLEIARRGAYLLGLDYRSPCFTSFRRKRQRLRVGHITLVAFEKSVYLI